MILTSTSAAATSPSPELPPSVHPQSAITTTRAGTNTSGGRLHRQTAHKAIERTTDFCIKIDDEGEDEGGIYEPDASIERHDSEFTCDADGNSFTEIEPFHNHDPHELKKLSPHGDCPICQYTFKSSEEKEAHMNRTNHGTYLHRCDFPDCKYKCRASCTLLVHMDKHYAEINSSKHVSKYSGPGTPVPVLGLHDGNKCPQCDTRIICLSHYIWHMDTDHTVVSKGITLIRHLRCYACTACVPLESARKHLDVFCPFSVIPELRSLFNYSDDDKKLTICDCKGAARLPQVYPPPLAD
ncbi:hypothetical protein AAVH_02151 [Aphelenchoides avenae]|nr:hypothetical protein AAVH_02151 [Aphelenchus avenae]